VQGELSLFSPNARVTALNIEGRADAHFDGSTIPFADDSFDAAVSLDVLEHISPSERGRHLSELQRVAARLVVVCCPLGTNEHVKAERELAAWYRDLTGTPHRFLEEHIDTGLPTEAELRSLAAEAGLHGELRFQGEFRRANQLFRLGAEAKARRRPITVARYAVARAGLNRRSRTTGVSRPEANRVFLVSKVTRP